LGLEEMMPAKNHPKLTSKVHRLTWFLILAAWIGWACNLPGIKAENPAPPQTPITQQVSQTTSQPTATKLAPSPTVRPADMTAEAPTQTAAPPPALTHTPLYWFGPLPPLKVSQDRPYIGSEDFMQLFEAGAPWPQATSHLQVFKLYGEWVAYSASDQELRQALESLRTRGLALAVEVGPLTANDDCGHSIEGYAGIPEGLEIARRIQQAGGKIDILAMDEPYYYGHFYDGPKACHWTDEAIARQAGQFIQAMRAVFPDVLVGDTEPLVGPAGANEYQAWMVAFKAVNGYDLAFLHLDIDWSRPQWPQEALAIEAFGRQRGIPVGMIYTGNFMDLNDQAWLSICGERIKRYEIETGGNPAHVIFQSWNDKPDHNLPESDPFTFTSLIRQYFEDKTGLGFQPGRAGSNLAYNKPARFSQALPGYPGELAVDGDSGTWWSAGGGPPQWIEINLGAPYAVQTIRLILSQSPAGMSVHQVRGRGPEKDAPYITLHTFSGVTDDLGLLTISPDQAWENIQYIRIETLQSPSWIAWREIEVFNSPEEDKTQ